MELSVVKFRGLNTKQGEKFVPNDSFYDILNFNYDNNIGANKIKCPDIIYNGTNAYDIDGIFDFRYINSSHNIVIEDIECIDGKIYKNLISGSGTLIADVLITGKCQFEIYQNKLFIVNGKNFPKIYDGSYVYEMGAPRAEVIYTAGLPNGSYYYAMTYVTAGGEEVLGTVSNTITANLEQISLTLPLGYSGTTSRKIYRTTAGGAQLMLVTTIADNTTLQYVDNTADGSLGAVIPTINNPCPKPYFLEISDDKLIGAVEDNYQTQIWVTDNNIEVFDNNVAIDISNISSDNSRIKGLKRDYGKIIVGSEHDIYVLDVTGATNTIISTRSGIGIKDGYTIQRLPQGGQFDGGVIFLSTLNDIRVFSGNFAQPVATSLDNLTTNNFSELIQYTLEADIGLAEDNFYSLFYDYKYHLVLGRTYYVFDININAWSKYNIETDSYASVANYLAEIDDELYIGQKGADIIEKAYQSVLYRNEAVSSYILTPQILASDEVKYLNKILIYFVANSLNKWKVTVIVESEYNNILEFEVNFRGRDYDSSAYSGYFYLVSNDREDFREIHINQWARWVQIKIEADEQLFLFRGYKIIYDDRNYPEKG